MLRNTSAMPELNICPLPQSRSVHQPVVAPAHHAGEWLARVGRQRFARRIAYATIVAAIGVSAALPAQGQSTNFMGALVQPCSGSCALPGLPQGVARDLQGNLWVSTQFGSGVTEVLAVNGVLPVPPATPSAVNVASGSFVNAEGLAFDSAGDLWVADEGANAIYEMVAISGSLPSNPTIKTIISTGISLPWSVAFDASGNLWFCDRNNNEIKEALAVSGSVPANPTINVVGSGFNSPQGVWVDALGNVFVADTQNGVIKEMVGVAPPAVSTPPATPTINTIATGFTFPESVAVDSQGDVWVADNQSGYFSEVVAVNGGIPANPVILPFATWPTSPSGQEPAAVTIDAAGDIFLGESLGSTNSIVSELTPSVNFGQTYVGEGASAQVLPTTANATLLFGSTGSVAAAFTPAVYTQGITGLDFAFLSTQSKTNSCASLGASGLSPGSVCTVDVTFTPLYPGKRLGAVQLNPASGAALATALLSGVGVAPLINFGIEPSPGVYAPTTSTTFSFNAGTNVAVDPNHNLYVNAGNAILEATAASSYQATNTVVAANSPNSVALDGAGDLIWTDYGSGQILEAVAVNGVIPANPTPVPLGSGWSVPWSSVVDPQGDVFVANTGNNPGLYEIVAVHGAVSSSSTVQLIENTYTPLWMAFDSSGNLYFTGQYQHACVYEIPAVGGQILASTPSQQVVCGFGLPLTIAIDAAGDLWEADFYSGVSKVEAVNGVIPASPTIIDYSTYAFGLGLDENGNVFWSTYEGGNDNSLIEYDFADPPSFTWSGQTNVGQTAAQTFEAFAENAGNMPLTLEVPSSGVNPSINPNWTWNTTATGACPSVASGASAAVTLPVSAQCDLTISFSPLDGGTLTGNLTFTDDNLYVVSDTTKEGAGDATQNIGLAGDGLGSSLPTATLTGISFGNEPQGQQSATMSATLTNTSTTTALSITGITVTGTNSADFTITTGANACSLSTPVAAGGSCSIYAYFTPRTTAAESATLNVADNAIGSTQTAPLTGTGTSSPVATLSANALKFGGVQINTASVPLVVTVTNSGSAQLNITGESITQTGSAFAIVSGGNQCSTNPLPGGNSCNIYVTYNPTVSGTASSGTLTIGGVSQTVSLTGTGVSFVIDVQQATTPQLVAVNIAAAGTLAAINIESTGSSNYVFGVENTGNTCTYGTAYTVGQLCQVSIFFTPLDPGDNPGAVILSDANGNVLGETYLAGTGQGSQAVFYSPHTAPNTVASSLSGPYGIAVDTAGNVYVAESNGSNVLQIPPVSAGGGIRKPESHRVGAEAISANTAYGTPIPLGGGVWDNPSGIAVDGAGDVFVADSGNNQVWEMMWNGSSRTFGAPFVVYNEEGESSILPVSVAVDNYGNLYLGVDISSDGPNGTAEILELPQTNFGAFGNPITIAQNLFTGWDDQRSVPFGLTVDSQGNVYAGVFSTNSVVEFSPTGPGTFTSGTTLNLTGLQSVTALARDANDDLYIADPLNGQVVTYHNQSAEVTLFNQESVGLAVDQQGDVFAGLSAIPNPGSTDSVVEYSYSQPVPLTFATTAVGSVSSDSPMTETILNIGNTDLYFNAQDNNPVYPVNFPINSNDNNLCEEDNSVSAGSYCDVSANFAPTVAGTLSGDIVLTDNSLNRVNDQQNIPVSGTATGSAAATATLTGISFGSVTEGVTSAAMTATLTNTSTSAALTISGITITGANAGDFAMTTGTGACGASLAANTSCKIYATFTPSVAGAETATLNVADNTTGSPQTGALTGTGTAPLVPAASLSPTTLPFGNQAVNTSSAVMTTTLSNTGTGVLNIIAIYLNEPNEEDVAKGPRASAITIASSPDYSATTTCGATLAAGASCTISVTFKPQSVGSLPGTLSVSDNAANSPQTASLTGTGVTQGNYTVASPTPPQTVVPGKKASYTINVSVAPNGDIFNNPVTLSASGLPAGATASFSPVMVTPGTSTATSTMSVQTAADNALFVPAGSSKWPIPSSLALMFGGAWALFRRRHRERFARIVSMALLLGSIGAATMGLMGCGGGFDKNTLPPSKTYTITVTGTSGEETQTTTVQLTVE